MNDTAIQKVTYHVAWDDEKGNPVKSHTNQEYDNAVEEAEERPLFFPDASANVRIIKTTTITEIVYLDGVPI